MVSFTLQLNEVGVAIVVSNFKTIICFDQYVFFDVHVASKLDTSNYVLKEWRSEYDVLVGVWCCMYPGSVIGYCRNMQVV